MSFSVIILPFILSVFSLYCLISKKDTQASFISGASEGIKSAFALIPTLVLLLTSVSVFSASGGAELIGRLLSPLLTRLGIPKELAPLLIVRPLSGSGATALLSDVFERHGPDSFIGLCASVISGSSDTVLYVTALYMSGAGATKSRYTLPCAIAVMLFGTVFSCLIADLIT